MKFDNCMSTSKEDLRTYLIISALCKVPDMVNGYSYPASGYTISDKTTVYTHCKDHYSVQHNILQSRPCGQLDTTKTDFPNCYSK